jgi:hypothetical protein
VTGGVALATVVGGAGGTTVSVSVDDADEPDAVVVGERGAADGSFDEHPATTNASARTGRRRRNIGSQACTA